VGGVREKIHAARRMRLSTIILPKDNQKDLVKISRQELNNLDIRLVDSMDEVLDIALKPSQDSPTKSTRKQKKKESRKTSNVATSQS
jgi:ATP-dependent Lon protease